MFDDIIKKGKENELGRMDLAFLHTIHNINKMVDMGILESVDKDGHSSDNPFTLMGDALELIKDFEPTQEETIACLVYLRDEGVI